MGTQLPVIVTPDAAVVRGVVGPLVRTVVRPMVVPAGGAVLLAEREHEVAERVARNRGRGEREEGE